MSLSAREQRILSEIARHLAAAEPRLARALVTARLPEALARLRPLVVGGQQHPGAWTAAILGPLAVAGHRLATAGVVLWCPRPVCAGAVMTQFAPAALGYLGARRRRSRAAARR